MHLNVIQRDIWTLASHLSDFRTNYTPNSQLNYKGENDEVRYL